MISSRRLGHPSTIRNGLVRACRRTLVQVRSTALRRVRVSAVGAVCGFGLAATVWSTVPRVVQWAKAHPYFALAAIEVDGNRRLTRQEILDWIGLQERTSAWDAAPGVVHRRLLAHPWVQRASVQGEFPARLLIAVQERRPVAIVRMETLQYVDRDGHILGPLRDEDSRDFPLITGLDGGENQSFGPLGTRRALQFLHLCERLNCFDGVSEVRVDWQRGVTVFPLRPAVAVVLGWGRWREKLARSAHVLAVWQGQVGRLAAVDVSFRDFVVVRLREEHRPAVRSLQRGMRI